MCNLHHLLVLMLHNRRVCHDFVQALKCVPQAGIAVAVGCRELHRSNEFADLHGESASVRAVQCHGRLPVLIRLSIAIAVCMCEVRGA